MQSLNLLIFAGYYLPYRGGYVESLHGLCRRWVSAGHRVTVVTGNVEHAFSEETIDGVRIFRVPVWHALGKTYPIIVPGIHWFRTLNLLRKTRFNWVSTQTRFFTISFWGTLFGWLTRTPRFHVERGAYHSVVEKPTLDLLSRAVDHTLGAMVVRTAKVNVGVSNAACVFLKHLGVRNPHWIPNGVEVLPPLPDHEKTTLKVQLGFKPEDSILLFVGRLVYAKGAQDVLKIFPSLRQTHPHLHWVIGGDGPYRATLEADVRAAGLSSFVHFPGLLSAEEVRTWLHVADWFVNPSHSEGLPRSVLEAAAAGLPIVASDVGGTAEILPSEKEGLLYPPKDTAQLLVQLKNLMKDPEHARSRGQAAQHHVATHYAWDRVVRSYVDLLGRTM